jgi:NAD(P)-dependent dehydrogenase (short-subunit alcohol dehydrogenase family)
MTEGDWVNVIDKFRVVGKRAVVTGASSGLGVAFAIALAEAGADVALGARRVERLESTRRRIEELERRSIAVATDVTLPDDCHALARATMEQLGGVDILINCAGLGTSVPASRESPEQFRRVVETNLMGSYWMAQACAKFMEPGASIINISSVLGFTSTGLPQAAYASSKTAIIGLTRDLAQQWSGRKGIRVNALAPGFFPTEMTDELEDGYLREIIEQRVPLGRTGHLEECAAVAVFLASEAASYVTGVCIPVDGGLLTS